MATGDEPRHTNRPVSYVGVTPSVTERRALHSVSLQSDPVAHALDDATATWSRDRDAGELRRALLAIVAMLD